MLQATDGTYTSTFASFALYDCSLLSVQACIQGLKRQTRQGLHMLRRSTSTAALCLHNSWRPWRACRIALAFTSQPENYHARNTYSFSRHMFCVCNPVTKGLKWQTQISAARYCVGQHLQWRHACTILCCLAVSAIGHPLALSLITIRRNAHVGP